MKQHAIQKANDVISRSFQINITVCDLDPDMIHRLTTTVERIMRKTAVTVLIAKNETVTTRFDVTCAIIFPKPVKQSAVTRNIRYVHIPSCFKEVKINRLKLLVTATPREPFDDTTFWRMHEFWSKPPWTIIHAGPGAAATRLTGSHFPLSFPNH